MSTQYGNGSVGWKGAGDWANRKGGNVTGRTSRVGGWDGCQGVRTASPAGTTSTVAGPSTAVTTTLLPVVSGWRGVGAWYSTVRFCRFSRTLPTPVFWPGMVR